MNLLYCLYIYFYVIVLMTCSSYSSMSLLRISNASVLTNYTLRRLILSKRFEIS